MSDNVREASGVMRIRDTPERWEVVDRQELCAGHVFRVRRDLVRMPKGDGTEVVARDVVEHPGSVGVLALDDEDRVLLVRQYRHPIGYRLWEVPAGLRDVDGEPLWETAAREFAEEAGHRAERWHTLVDTFTSPGMGDERQRVFLARGISEIPEGELDFERVHEEADMPVAWVPLDEAVAKVLGGDLRNPTAVVGILAAYAARAGGFRDLRPADALDA
ncbi:NUDIX domain-containing protein [Actinomadura alba]|uniref:NUDIX hydrolase n=1 Tax=Actinomadura alba TaxID=406431 RepID=A0ABR7LWL5_9ACTN|nr:NUDIX hydrolase [Actinomadura alba]MBC6469140.1 NUDIX hydrolase [Actinomadura alba]